MAQQTSNKLRRMPVEAPARGNKPPPPASLAWRGLGLDGLSDSLAKTHHEKIVWKKLAECLSASLDDQAIAFAQRQSDRWVVLAADGLHEQLRDALVANDERCPFLARPDQHIEDLVGAISGMPEACHLYEFIEHYWGWRLASEQEHPIYLMIFGAERHAPTELAQNAAHLASYLCWHISSEKRRKQLISDLSAETQGLRVSAADVLRRRLDQWMVRDDGIQ